MKRLISFILIFTLIISMFNFPVNAVEPSVIEIKTWEDLHNIRNNLSGNYKLMNDLGTGDEGYITYASSSANGGLGWEPIGNYSTRFIGHFDGNGKTISGLTINRPSGQGIGLFGFTNTNAKISNVKLKDVNVSGKSSVGGLVGWAENTIISDCSVTGAVIGSAVAGGTDIGGLVGRQYKGEITTSYADASVSGYTILGGLVGSSPYGNINNSYAKGNVHGYLDQLKDKYPGGEAGGLVGGAYGGTITKCYATGKVTGTVYFKGVLVGFLGNDSAVTNSFFDNTIYSFPLWFGIGGKPNPYTNITQDITSATTGVMQTKSTFTNKGWDFDKIWAIDEGTSYPYFKPKLIKVSFNMGDNYVKAPSDKYYEPDLSLTYGSDLPDSSFIRPGYTFKGWYTEADGGDEVTSSSNIKVAADHTLYAQWEGKDITVNFDSSGGSTTPNSIPVTVGGSYDNLPTLENRAGYTFDGWYTAAIGGDEVTSNTNVSIPNDHILYARWKGEQYTVSFDLNKDTSGVITTPSAITVTYGSTYEGLPKFGVTTIGGVSYWLDGWYTDASAGSLVTNKTIVKTTTDHALYAHWSEAELNNVIYDGNGNTTGAAIESVLHYPGDTVTVTDVGDLAREGYDFAGWNSEADGTGETYEVGSTFEMLNKELTLYAIWQPKDIQVSFAPQAAEVTTPGPINVTFDGEYGANNDFKNTIQNLTRTGYDLLGWFKEQVSALTSTWNANKKEWAVSSLDNSLKVENNTKVTNPDAHILYAQWAPKIFTLEYDTQGGEIIDGVSSATAIYDFKYGQLKTATRQGYTLNGWYASDGTKVESTDVVKLTNDQTLYAKWTPNTDTPYTVGHYHQNIIGDGYIPIDYETKTGETNTNVTVDDMQPQVYEGFTENQAKRASSGTIAGDGSLALGYYYDRNTYTVTFNSNGGSDISPETIRYGGTITTQPIKPGYNFAGWYKDADLKTKWNLGTDTVTATTALYAKWTSDDNGGDGGGYQPKTEQINVDVETGKLGQDVVSKTPITRTTDADGKKNDKVTFAPELAKETIKSIIGMGQNLVRVVITDPKDEVSSIDFSLPKDTHKQIADAKVNFEIYTENAKVLIPPSSLANLEKDLYFRFVPIKEEPLRREVEERARVEKIVTQFAKGQKINVVTRPMTIETNMQSRAVTLVFPLRDVELPTNIVEREKFLSDLVIFIEHSDGDKELLKPEAVEYNQGMLGLQFGVNKFSTFTILNMEGYNELLNTQSNQHNSYIKGYGDNTFKPEKSISRAEMAAILARNLGFDATKTVYSTYPDLKETHWALKEIEFIKATGLMIGDANGNFRPDAPISRGEMAAIGARYKKLDTIAYTKSSFIDVEASYWGVKEIEAVRKAGIVDGYFDNTYKPHNNLSRAEAVKIVNRLFERGPLFGVNKPSWPDVPTTHWSYMEIEEASQTHYYIPRQGGGEDILY